VVTDRYKLVHFYEPDVNEWELFDLKNDPNELKNVLHLPELLPVQSELRRELQRLRQSLNVPISDPRESAIP
jgi:hypothetical protein